MGEEPMRVARSVAAACLLDHYAETEPVFTPYVSDMMVAYLNRLHLITPAEKEALLKAAAVESEQDSDNEKIISAIGKSLLSIEKDTGAVTCFVAPILDSCGKNRVFALSIRPHLLVDEILPISLRFQDLTISPTYINDSEEYERLKQESIRQLDSKKKWAWIKCPDKYITKPTPAPHAFN